MVPDALLLYSISISLHRRRYRVSFSLSLSLSLSPSPFFPLSRFTRILSASSSITMADSNKQHRCRKLETTYPFYRGKYAQDPYGRIPFSARVSSFSSSFLRITRSRCRYGENINLGDGDGLREHHECYIYIATFIILDLSMSYWLWLLSPPKAKIIESYNYHYLLLINSVS